MYSNACLYTRPTAKNTIDGVERKLLYTQRDRSRHTPTANAVGLLGDDVGQSIPQLRIGTVERYDMAKSFRP